MTWEPVSSLAQSLIDDFEKGVIHEEVTETETSFGVVSHKLTVSEVDKPDLPPKKKKLRINVDHGYANPSTIRTHNHNKFLGLFLQIILA